MVILHHFLSHNASEKDNKWINNKAEAYGMMVKLVRQRGSLFFSVLYILPPQMYRKIYG